MRQMAGPCPDPERLAGWVEETLAPEDRGDLAAHLSECDRCRRAVVLAGQMEAPAGGGRVDETLLQRVVRTARWRPWWTWAAAAACLAALGLSLMIPGGSVEESPESPVTEAPAVPETIAPDPAPLAVEVPPAVAPVPEPVEPVPAKPIPPAPPVEPRRDLVKAPVPEPPAPPVPEPAPAPVPAPAPEEEKPVVKRDAGRSETDLDLVFHPVYVVDPTATLRLGREGGDPAAVRRFEEVGRRDVFSAPESAAAFTVESRAAVVLEKGAETGISFFAPDKAYALLLRSGSVMIDTGGAEQTWRVTRGPATVTLEALNGQAAVESRGDGVSAVLLEGRAQIRVGAASEQARVGREVVLSAKGAREERKVRVSAKRLFLRRLRPAESTMFLADFDEDEGARKGLGYTLAAGRVKGEGTALFLHAEPDAAASKPGRTVVSAALVPLHPFRSTTDMMLRFRYRTSVAKIRIRLGDHSVEVPTRPGSWRTVEVSLETFEREGVPLLPDDPVGEVRFESETGNRAGLLDVDSVQFVRRAR